MIGRSRETLARYVLERYHVKKEDGCVSVPSMSLYKSGYLFLDSGVG